MSKFELSISPNYVPHWTVKDAVRELFQNALDQEIADPDCKANWVYLPHLETLTITSDNASLTPASLLLGVTSKSNDDKTIGQFGEGYKIATLVLLRSGLDVSFYNYGAKEIWRPRLVKSRKYGTSILTFFTEKVPKTSAALKHLEINIRGITQEMYDDEILPSNLHLQSDTLEYIERNVRGDVLKDMQGKVFVNGLFVCNYENYVYGYNFKPEDIKLDRDRKMISDFNLKWQASKIWALSTNVAECVKMLSDGAEDVAYIDRHLTKPDMRAQISDAAYDKFKETYGQGAIPIEYPHQAEDLPKGYSGHVVPDSTMNLIKASTKYVKPEPKPEKQKEPAQPSLKTKLLQWFLSDGVAVSSEAAEDFNNIICNLKTNETEPASASASALVYTDKHCCVASIVERVNADAFNEYHCGVTLCDAGTAQLMGIDFAVTNDLNDVTGLSRQCCATGHDEDGTTGFFDYEVDDIFGNAAESYNDGDKEISPIDASGDQGNCPV